MKLCVVYQRWELSISHESLNYGSITTHIHLHSKLHKCLIHTQGQSCTLKMFYVLYTMTLPCI